MRTIPERTAPFAASGGSTRLRPSGRSLGVGLLLIAIVAWGANWPVMKTGLSHITPIWFSALRFLLGAICLFALQAATGTLRLPVRADVPVILSVGLLQMLAFTVLGAIAMQHVSAGRSAILAYTTPLWVTPVAVLVFHEKLSKWQKAGLALALAGAATLFNPLTMDWAHRELVEANMMLLLAALCWALCILHLRYGGNASSAYQLAPWQMATATLPLLLLARAIEGPYTGDNSATFWAVSLYVGPIATAFCFCAVNAASRWLSSTSMSSSMLGVPVIGLVSSVLFLGEALSIGLLVGMSAIVAGVLIVTLNPGRARAA